MLHPARESTAGLLHGARAADSRGDQVLHARAEASPDHLHSWQMCWVLPAPPFPGRCQVVLGWWPALTMKEGVVQEDGALSGLYCSAGLSNCKCVTPARVGPCATPVCQIWGVSTPGPRCSLLWAKVISWQDEECCTGGKEHPGEGVGGQIPAVPVLSDAMGTHRQKIISDERLNTPLGEEYSSSLSEPWLLGEPNQSPVLVVKVGSNHFIYEL